MPRQVKKFCRLTKYLQQTDKSLYQVFDDLCLFSLFSKRGGRGITFLYPAGKSYRKKIIELAYSNTPEKAVDMIKALVLMDYLPSTSDFESKKDDIPNSLRKKLDVESADSKVVKLKGGLKLEAEKKYIKLYDNDNTAVYILSGSGFLPTTGTASSMKYTQQSAVSIKGGYTGGNNIKSTLEAFVNEKYKENVNVYKNVVAVICKFAVKSDDKELQNRVYSGLCATHKASYYNLVNPYSNKDPYGIGNVFNMLLNLIDEWDLVKEKDFQNAIDELIELIHKKTSIDIESKIQANVNEQNKILKECINHIQYVAHIKTAYNNNERALYKDLLTVYCYLDTIYSEVDNDYHINCFIPVMKYLFNDERFLINNSNDLGNTLTLYGNLLKSDAFKYIPTKSSQEGLKVKEKGFKNLGNELPPPKSETLYTIQYNSTIKIKGGGQSSIAEFMGGNVEYADNEE